MLSKLDGENFTSLTRSHIATLFDTYDDVFFNGAILRRIKDRNHKLTFAISKSTSKVAGLCRRDTDGSKVCTYTLEIPDAMFITKFTSGKAEMLRANGIPCTTRLECLQLVFEHELTHLIMFVWNVVEMAISQGRTKATYSPHGSIFKCLVKHFFNHTGVRHELLGGDISKQLSRDNFRVGETISVNVRGKDVLGTIMKINPKTARVNIPSLGSTFKISYALLMKTDERIPQRGIPSTGGVPQGPPIDESLFIVEHPIGKTPIPPIGKQPIVTSKFFPPSTRLTRSDVKIGDAVTFKVKGNVVAGVVRKMNPKNAHVFVDKHDRTYGVNYALLTKLVV